MTTFPSEQGRFKPLRRRLRLIAVIVGTMGVMTTVVILQRRAFDNVLPPPLAANLDMPVQLPDGRAATIRDLVRPDRPTVINLWASWCGPCRKEAPTVVDLHRRFGERINLIYLNVRDEDATRADLSTYMTSIGLPSEAYARLDRGGSSRLTGTGNGLVPRTMVFDNAGRPTAMITGYKPLALARIAGMVD